MRRADISFFPLGVALGAQAPHFDAVSIKPSPSKFGSAVSPIQAGRWRESSITLVSPISFAYNLPGSGSGSSLEVEGGPAEATSLHFAIDATVSSAQVSPDEQRAPVRGLLADRFHLVSHAATEFMPAYALELAPGGPTLKPASAACDTNPPPGIPAKGAPPRCGSVTILPGDGPDTMNDADSRRTNILALEKALESQTGLRINLPRPVKLPVKAIVIDSAEMPTN